jgi:uncharacterized membrane protein YkvA (DUF1232 family)
MNQSHVKILLLESGFSPEQLGARTGISGMTFRRWSELPDDQLVPELYRKAIHEVVYELMAEGLLSEKSEVVKATLKESDQSIFGAAIKNLGFSADFLKNGKPNSESVVKGISHIGGHEGKQASVERSKKKILSYGKLGSEWKYRIKSLIAVIKSKDITHLDKFAAYGALFYLLTPFDLIPDHIPVFGLMDDFFILGIVTLYYAKRFPQLIKRNDNP